MVDNGIVSEWVDIAVGDETFSAYVAVPREPGRYPGVVVGHEIYGLHPSALAATERIARLGTIAILPDLFHRVAPRVDLEIPRDRNRALELLRTLRRENVAADIGATVDELSRRGAKSVNAIGFSSGGHVAYYASSRLPLKITVAFYPGSLTATVIPLSRPNPTVCSTPGITGRVVLFFGGQDRLIDGDTRTQVADALRRNSIDHELIVYEDASHGFMFPGRDGYHPDRATDAWNYLGRLFAS